MLENIAISGFSDEISSDLNTQLKTVNKLGMHYISLRGIDDKNISKYSVDMIKNDVLPRLSKWDIGVSSIGSPIGKIYVDDETAFQEQLAQLKTLCEISQLLNCRYIRIFSFYIPRNEDFDKYKDSVIEKLKQFAEIAEQYNVILLHENEKDIFGDIARRCKLIFDEVGSTHFKAIFDFANFVQCGENTQACYELLSDYIEYIHIKDAVYKDNVNVLCGTGDGQIESILTQIFKAGYKGFLTLEPHLVVFDSIKDLELEHSTETIQNSVAKDGAEGYKMQYEALLQILANINKKGNV
ncbi:MULTISPECIES: sugar phosphate isomerase/epimerase family protein [Staphylococcus]|jgi:sugar phosphate isomerase/epimerase|uniref:L-xylulose 5-phosphate 3-epimerase n=1 Tax=Staphylococcus nepalensis TaxID=214473 RepID=A0A2T4SDT3_9STAP|nr:MULTISPECIES: sugar phosphate isomerase/epimerase family protein [Staphylococcus]VDG67116.1 sugar phosphate isomerase/epimerase [Lacrimispora indolis]MBO1204931.1 sugar phosphate isomerase/epimerase [Staphylococcus nepalensis]MBO1213523.1 sugar phosphate isomerase/epimerase [Staphylococcus nepalensis]MBO1215255.1 sugar phosphate isomerase/epimerase [Staphylococcus nepalensis]MBO1220758.1 sugar phosphate isomerase/epimerase [Staphylococcus nepalensis]